MWEWAAGILAFVLYVLYDWNRVFLKKAWLRPLFTAGSLLLVLCGGRLVLLSWSVGSRIWLVPASLCLAGLVYTLFFALPFDSTYCREADRGPVCRSGIYGWCRHPGIWWFFGCFGSLGMACRDGRQLAFCLTLSALNLAYAWYQDRLIFVREFSDYKDYQREVPFLVPNGWRKGGGGKNDL